MKKFDITVWYRYRVAGEQEQDFEVHTIESENVQEAVNKASLLYTSLSRIPFSYEHENVKYTPNI